MVAPYDTAATQQSPGGFGTGPWGVDPAVLRNAQFSNMLMGIGTGLLSAPNWQQGVGQGMYLGNQLAQQGRATALDDAQIQLRMKEYEEAHARQQREYEQQQAQAAAMAKLAGSGQYPGLTPDVATAYPNIGEKLIENQLTPQKPYSTIGNLEADLKAGRISQADFDAAKKKENYIAYPQPQQPTEIQTRLKLAVDAWNTANPDKPGRPTLQFLQDYGVTPQAVKQDLVQSADPNSPTGISYQPKAAGLPGVPPAASESLTNKTALEFQNRQIAAAQVNSLADKIKGQLTSGTPIGGTGWLTQTIAGAGAQAKQAAQALGADTKLLDPATYGINTSSAGASSAALQSDILGLAYSIALAQNGTRVTEQDVRKALAQIGSADVLADPRQMAAALDSIVGNLQSNLKIESQMRGMPLIGQPQGQAQTAPGNDYESRYGLAPLP